MRRVMIGPSALVLSMLMLGAVALVIGGLVQIRRSERRGWLMLFAAAILFGNVLIWAV